MAKVLKCECKAKNMNFGKFHRSTMLHGLLAWIGQRDYVGNWLNIKSKKMEKKGNNVPSSTESFEYYVIELNISLLRAPCSANGIRKMT